MNRGLWIARKNYLCTLIRKVSDGCGVDSVEFLKQHCEEVINAYPNEKIETAIDCYKGLVEELNYLEG